jgi:hypothetical protein
MSRPEAVPSAAASERGAPAAKKIGRASLEWCMITFSRTERHAEFRVVVLEKDGRRRVAERSAPFRVPRSRQVQKRGKQGAAHAALVEGLLARGWKPLEGRGRWADTAFIRCPDNMQPSTLSGCDSMRSVPEEPTVRESEASRAVVSP